MTPNLRYAFFSTLVCVSCVFVALERSYTHQKQIDVITNIHEQQMDIANNTMPGFGITTTDTTSVNLPSIFELNPFLTSTPTSVVYAIFFACLSAISAVTFFILHDKDVKNEAAAAKPTE